MTSRNTIGGLHAKPVVIGLLCALEAGREYWSRKDWRTGWDSNPRYGFPYTRFPSERLQPLGHLSVRMSWLHARSFSSVKHRRAVVLPGCRRSESIILAGFGSGPARCIVRPPHRSGRRERHQTDFARGFWVEPVRRAVKNPSARGHRPQRFDLAGGPGLGHVLSSRMAPDRRH